ncbi:MAG: hypothetical protein ACOCX9_08190 [Spirochaetota bacterium]
MRILVNLTITILLLLGNYRIVTTMNRFTDNRGQVLLWILFWTIFWVYIFYRYNRNRVNREK